MTVPEIAEYHEVDERTVRRWIKSGKAGQCGEGRCRLRFAEGRGKLCSAADGNPNRIKAAPEPSR